MSSSDYPSDGEPHGGPGIEGVFTFTASGTADVVDYEYSSDGGFTYTPVTADSPGGPATLRYTPSDWGSERSVVRGIDPTGNRSQTTDYYLMVSNTMPAVTGTIGSSAEVSIVVDTAGQHTLRVTTGGRHGVARAGGALPRRGAAAAGGGRVQIVTSTAQAGRMRRRSLLGVAAAAGLAGAAAACDDEPAAAPAPAGAPPLIPTDWASVRAQFTVSPEIAHLSTFVFAPHPAPVRAAIERHRAGLDADPIGYLHQNEARLDERVAAAAADYLTARPEEIAFTDSTTMGLGLLYSGLRLAPGEEVLTTEHDFYATHESLRLRAERDGVTVRRTRLYADPATASTDEIVGNLTRAVTARTRVVAVTWVHSSTGVKLPIRAIADALRGRDVLLCVDAVHGFGAEDASPADLGCDFLVSGCHKWLLGPRGTGLVWGSAEGWARFIPLIPPFDGRSIGAWLGLSGGETPPGPAATPGGYHSFEHRWALAEAFDFHKAIGRQRVASRTHELATALKDGLAGIGGLQLATPKSADLSAGVVCCQLRGVSVDQAVARLGGLKVVASATPYQPTLLRFGTTIFNNEADVEATLKATRSLA